MSWKISNSCTDIAEVLPYSRIKVVLKLGYFLERFNGTDSSIMGYCFCHPVQYMGRKTEDLPYLPYGVSRLESDIGTDHGCIVPPIGTVDILDNFFSSVCGDINIDVRGAQF